MKYFGIRKTSTPDESGARANSERDLTAWQDFDGKRKHVSSPNNEMDEQLLPPPTSSPRPTAPVPVGLVGVVEKDGIDLLFAKDDKKKEEHQLLKEQVPVFENVEPVPIAPTLSSKKRFQAVQVSLKFAVLLGCLIVCSQDCRHCSLESDAQRSLAPCRTRRRASGQPGPCKRNVCLLLCGFF